MRILLLVCGYISLGLGAVGLFLPIVPTVPFLIVSAFCFSRSSPRLNKWLHDHNWFGPMLRDWNRERAIPLRAKIIATIMLIASLFLSAFVVGMPVGVIAAMAVIFAGVLAYIWTRARPARETR